MITKEQVIPLILEASPSFQVKRDRADDRELLYPVMGDLARHILGLYRESKTVEFPALCQAIESLVRDGDGYVKELAIIGLLEGVQNAWANNGADPEGFGKFLQPESRKAWLALNDFWSGKAKAAIIEGM